MTWTDPAVILMAVMLVWTIGFSIWNVRNRDFGKHATALADHEARLSRVEGFVERLPQQVASHSDVELVHGRSIWWLVNAATVPRRPSSVPLISPMSARILASVSLTSPTRP